MLDGQTKEARKMSDNESVMKKVKIMAGGGGGRQWDNEQGATNLAWTGVIKKVSLGGGFVRPEWEDSLCRQVKPKCDMACFVCVWLHRLLTTAHKIFLLPRDTEDLQLLHVGFSSLLSSRSVMSDSLQPHGL